MNTLDQWEAEAKQDLDFCISSKWFGDGRYKRRNEQCLALIELIRKKDSAIRAVVNSEAWNKFAGDSDKLFEDLEKALALTEELK